MTTNSQLSAASKTLANNAALNAALDVCNSGFLDVYSLTQPTNPDTALGAQVKLAHLPLASTAFAAASGSSKVAAAITSAAALATGTATWYSVTKSDGTRTYENTIGTSGSSINLNSVAIQSGATVSVSSLTISSTVS